MAGHGTQHGRHLRVEAPSAEGGRRRTVVSAATLALCLSGGGIALASAPALAAAPADGGSGSLLGGVTTTLSKTVSTISGTTAPASSTSSTAGTCPTSGTTPLAPVVTATCPVTDAVTGAVQQALPPAVSQPVTSTLTTVVDTLAGSSPAPQQQPQQPPAQPPAQQPGQQAPAGGATASQASTGLPANVIDANNGMASLGTTAFPLLPTGQLFADTSAAPFSVQAPQVAAPVPLTGPTTTIAPQSAPKAPVLHIGNADVTMPTGAVAGAAILAALVLAGNAGVAVTRIVRAASGPASSAA